MINNGCLDTISISFNDYQLSGIKEFFSIFNENETLKNVSFSIPNTTNERDLSTLGSIIIETLTTMKSSFRRLEVLG